jgi:carbamoyltransferase
MLTWLTEKLWIKGLLRDKFRLRDQSRILFSEHHLSHAASAYYCSPYSESAVLTADGVGEWATTTLGVGKGNDLRILYELRFPHSIGLLYSVFTAFLGFQVNDGEYKLMGMAAYGKPRYLDKIHKLLTIGSDGSISLNMKYFSFHRSTGQMFNRHFEELFGPPRREDEAETADAHYADIAASIQKVTEDILVKLAQHLKKITGMRYLCMAGGVALNGLANYRILRESGFEGIYIQPAASDAGGALGAAMWAYHMVENQPRTFTMSHAYWGKTHGAEQVADFLTSNNIPFKEAVNEDLLISTIVDSLQDGKVVAWYQGKAEWGPRALGNRSILADPGREDIKDVMNQKIKFREPFRPFAPSVVESAAGEYFDIPEAESQYPARFMLYVVPVQESKRHQIPGVTHVDGTARLQVVHQSPNPLYHSLISTWSESSGTPVLLNTSFNLRGEPIVNRPVEAYSTFSRSDIDILVMDRFICSKE